MTCPGTRWALIDGDEAPMHGKCYLAPRYAVMQQDWPQSGIGSPPKPIPIVKSVNIVKRVKTPR